MSGGWTVLVAEDDRVVRDLVGRVLQIQGYRVLAAEDPAAALALAAAHEGRIDLLLTDVVMPGMNGPELAERLRETRPETRVVYMSGFTAHASLKERIERGEALFLQKPFTVDALRRKLAEALGSL